MKKTLMIYDLGQIFGRPTRQDYLNESVDQLEQIFESKKPPIDVDPAPLLFDTMEKLVSDLSLVFESPYSNWSRECTINKTHDLVCQCSRIGRYCEYRVALWRYPNEEAPVPVGFTPVYSWVEMLPASN